MKKSHLLVCGYLFTLISTASHAALVVIDFDTSLADYVPDTAAVQTVTNEFLALGVYFIGASVMDSNGTSGCYVYGYCSGDLVILKTSTSQAGSVQALFPSGTDYFSVYASGAAQGGRIKAYDAAGNEVAHAYAESGQSSTTLTLNNVGVFNKVVMYTNSPAITWDDVTFNSPVPIPPSVWLFGSGLLGLIGIARCKKTI